MIIQVAKEDQEDIAGPEEIVDERIEQRDDNTRALYCIVSGLHVRLHVKRDKIISTLRYEKKKKYIRRRATINRVSRIFESYCSSFYPYR